MIAVLLLQYYDAESRIRPHTYSHTYNVTLLELFFLRIYHLLLINLVTPAKLAPDLGSQGHLRRENNVITSWWGWYPPQTTSNIPVGHIQSVWAIVMLSQGYMGAPLYRSTGQVGPRFGKSGSPVEWKMMSSCIVEADIHLRPFHTSILDMLKVFVMIHLGSGLRTVSGPHD